MIGAARLLKCLAAQHGMVVIVVNHIVGSTQVVLTVLLECQGSGQPWALQARPAIGLIEPVGVGN
jgi:hypothetical protein